MSSSLTRHATVGAYAAVLCGDLPADSEAALAAWDAMADLVRTNPRWACTLWAMASHAILATLPPRDPWRSLSGTSDGVVTRRPGHPEPRSEGAWIRWPGSPVVLPFNSWLDAMDLTQPHDARLAALSRDDLDPQDAALLAHAGHSAARALTAIHARWSGWAGIDEPHVSSGREPLRHLLVWQGANVSLRWAVHRRRTYVQSDDWLASMFEAMASAADADAGERSRVVSEQIALGRIDAAAYRHLARAAALG